MDKVIPPQKFFLYARKSTDVEDKQALSIEAQITELRAFTKNENLEIVEELIENYLKESGLSHTIFRPGSFFENFDDPSICNPLTKGHLKGVLPFTVQYIACYDSGRAAATVFTNFADWNGKLLNCVAFEGDGNQCAEALSRVSGVPCKFSVTMSRTFMYVLSCIPLFAFLYEIVDNFSTYNDQGLSDIAKFKEVVPDAMDAEGFFRKLGQWRNGEKFNI